MLSGRILNQYRVTNDPALLDRAASALEVLLSRTPAGTEQRRIAINNAATCLTERYQRRGSPHDLERVIELLQEELALSAGDAALLNSFGGALMLRHRATGSTDDLDHVIDAMETALKQTEASATGAHGRYLHSLAVPPRDRPALRMAGAMARPRSAPRLISGFRKSHTATPPWSQSDTCTAGIRAAGGAAFPTGLPCLFKKRWPVLKAGSLR